jgi:hypothetical protein
MLQARILGHKGPVDMRNPARGARAISFAVVKLVLLAVSIMFEGYRREKGDFGAELPNTFPGIQR